VRRKIIAQGGGGRTISLPIEWIRKNELKPGDELDIEGGQDNLVLTINEPHKKKKISIEIPDTEESYVRTYILNTYRVGYDSISVNYLGPESIINNVVETFLIGFEINKIDSSNYIIESISEPSFEKCESIIQRLFFIMSQILENILDKEIEQDVHKIQKYDNFLKRCLSKKVFKPNSQPLIWQFLSNMSHIARTAFHFKKQLNQEKNLDKKKLGMILKKLNEMIEITKQTYLKNDLINLHKVHEIYWAIQKDKSIPEKFSPEINYHLNILTRTIYLGCSPLIGYLSKS